MKKFLYEVLIKEFIGMRPLHIFFCAYFIISFAAVGSLCVDHTSPLAAIVAVINFAVSSFLLRRIPQNNNAVEGVGKQAEGEEKQ